MPCFSIRPGSPVAQAILDGDAPASACRVLSPTCYWPLLCSFNPQAQPTPKLADKTKWEFSFPGTIHVKMQSVRPGPQGSPHYHASRPSTPSAKREALCSASPESLPVPAHPLPQSAVFLRFRLAAAGIGPHSTPCNGNHHCQLSLELPEKLSFVSKALGERWSQPVTSSNGYSRTAELTEAC